MRKTYSLLWIDGTSPEYTWYIRGIKPDRSFYGEIKQVSGDIRKLANVEGSLSAEDYLRVLKLVEKLKLTSEETHGDPDPSRKCFIGDNIPGRSINGFRYPSLGKDGTERNSFFIQITEILSKYIKPHYSELECQARGV
jgi:hypothetical protein